MNPREFVRTEWSILRRSNVVRGLVTMELAAVAVFVDQVLSGKQELSLDALKGWLLLQACMVVAFLFRHAWAGVESQLDGRLPPDLLRRLQARVEGEALRALQDHPEAREKLGEALQKLREGEERGEAHPVAPTRYGGPLRAEEGTRG